MRITKATKQAIQTYYFNRSRAKDIKWNKTADLDSIANTCIKYSFEASCGTFWFTHKSKARRIIMRTDEKIFPNFAKRYEKIN